MRAQKIYQWILTLSMLTLASVAHAGGMEGGGGKVVVCKDSAGKQIVQLLDLWEAKNLYSRQIQYSDDSIELQVERALQNLKNSVQSSGKMQDANGHLITGSAYNYLIFRQQADRFFGDQPDVKRLRGVDLTLTDDSYELAKPANCEIQQLVVYLDHTATQDILINQDLFERLDNTNQTAAIMHEVFYKYLRQFSGETNSLRARRTVGLLMSAYKFRAIEDILPINTIVCQNHDTGPDNVVYIYQTATKPGENNIAFLPTVILGKYMIGFGDVGPTAQAGSLAEILQPLPSGQPAVSWGIPDWSYQFDQDFWAKISKISGGGVDPYFNLDAHFDDRNVVTGLNLSCSLNAVVPANHW